MRTSTRWLHPQGTRAAAYGAAPVHRHRTPGDIKNNNQDLTGAPVPQTGEHKASNALSLITAFTQIPFAHLRGGVA